MELSEYNETQRGIVDFVEKLTQKYDRKYWCGKVDDGFPTEMWDEIARNGYFGMVVPEEYNGSNLKLSDSIVFLEELGKHGVATLHFVGMYMIPILMMHGNEALKRKYLPRMSAGELCAFAITEPDAGTNTFKLRTHATRKGDHYKINGQKIFITGAAESRNMIVVTRTLSYNEVEDRRDGLSIFVVDTQSKGITMQAQNVEICSPEKQYTVFFDNVEVPEENLIGTENNGFQYLFDGLNMERIVIAAYSLGLGRFALNRAVEYVKERDLFGSPIGAYQGIQHPLSRAFVGLHLASLAIRTAAKAMDEKKHRRLVGLYANMAKLTASEQAFKACDIAIQAHGGYGMTREYDVVNVSSMVRTMRLAPINNEMILNFIGESYLKLPRSY